jgi:hypothetical protein
MIALLNSIPIVIWSGLFGAFLALTGVLLSNRENRKRLEVELKHKEAENEKERFADLRHQIYLSAAEEIVKVNVYVSRFVQIDMTQENIGDGFSLFSSIMAKLQLVAEPKTSLLVGKLVTTYGEMFGRAMTEIVPLQLAQQAAKINKVFLAKSEASVETTLQEIAMVQKAGNPSRTSYETHEQYLKFHEAQASGYCEKMKNADRTSIGLQLSFMKWLLNAQIQAMPDMLAVLIAIRSDLGLVDKDGEFRLQTETIFNKRFDSARGFIAQVEKTAENLRATD